MAVTIHLIGIPLVLLTGLLIGGFVGFLIGLRAGAKRQNESDPSRD
jgi:membrane protein DedA with SNARE-associated domain